MDNWEMNPEMPLTPIAPNTSSSSITPDANKRISAFLFFQSQRSNIILVRCCISDPLGYLCKTEVIFQAAEIIDSWVFSDTKIHSQ